MRHAFSPYAPPHTLRPLPPLNLPRLGGGDAEVRWLTASSARSAARAARASRRSGRCSEGTCERGAGAGSWGNGDERRGRQVRRARFPYAPPPSAPFHPLSCHGLEAGLARCGGLQLVQRSEPPELRGQAAAQVVVLKPPARGAPERDHGGMATNVEGGKCDARASPMRRRTLRALPPALLCHGLEAGVPRCGGSQFRQRGEPPELRGQAAAQVVAAKTPARGAPERDHGGTAANAESSKCDACASPTRPSPPSVPSHPLRCHGLEAGVPRCGGSQVCQRGKQPELRGQAAAQVVVVQVPARGAPERDHGGTAANAEGGKCDARASPCTPPPSVPSHPLYPATA